MYKNNTFKDLYRRLETMLTENLDDQIRRI